MAAGKVMEAIVSIAGQIDPSLQKAIAGASKHLGSVQKAAIAAGTVTAAGVAAITTAAVAATKGLYDLGVEFDSAVDTIRIGTGATGEALDALYGDMKELYKSVPTTLENASSAIADYNTRLGLTGEPLQELSKQAIQVCDMLGEDLSQTIEDSSKAFEQWDVSVNDMADQMDYIFKVSQSTGTGFNTLMGDMQSYGAQLQELGFDFNEAAVLIGQMDKAGINTNEVLNAMKKSVSTMAAAGLSASDGLEQYYTAIINAKDATEATTIASEVFGTKAASTMAAAIREGSLSVGELTDSLLASEETINGAATDTYDFAEQFQLLKQNAQVALEPIATEIFNLTNKIMPFIQDAFNELIPIISDFGGILMPILEELSADLFPVVTEVLSEFGGLIKEFLPYIADGISKISKMISKLIPITMNIIVAIIPVLADVLTVVVNVMMELMPIISELISSLLPVISQLIIAILPIITTLINALMPIISIITQLVMALLPPIVSILDALMPLITFAANIISFQLTAAMQMLTPILEVLISLVGKVGEIFESVFSGLVGLVAEPVNAIIQMVNSVITAINGAGFVIPDWVPVVGGKEFSLNLPLIPMLASGGFTDGLSIAGEEGVEAVISFNPAYRDENVSYWAQAGRMLGVDDTFLDTIESGSSQNESNQVILNVTYAPEVTVTGENGSTKEDIMAALEEREEEFTDMLEKMLRRLDGGSYKYG